MMKKKSGQSSWKKLGRMVIFLKQLLLKKRYSAHQKKRQRVLFIRSLSDLLLNGFSIQESLRYLVTLERQKGDFATIISQELAGGASLSSSFSRVGFSKQQVTLLYLAETHGDLIGTLTLIHKQMEDRERQWVELKKVLAYPSLLLLFLIAILLLMKSVILPQLGLGDETQGVANLGRKIIENGPIMLGILVVSILVIVCIIQFSFRNKSNISRLVFWSKIPFVGLVIQRYTSSFFASEFGKLLNQGLEMKQIVYLMSQLEEQTFLKEMAIDIGVALEKGQSIIETLKAWPFLKKELVWIIQQGEVKGKLGDELQMYGKQLWEELNKKVVSLFSWIQPLIFILVAFLILLVYASLLLPIYQEMEGML